MMYAAVIPRFIRVFICPCALRTVILTPKISSRFHWSPSAWGISRHKRINMWQAVFPFSIDGSEHVFFHKLSVSEGVCRTNSKPKLEVVAVFRDTVYILSFDKVILSCYVSVWYCCTCTCVSTVTDIGYMENYCQQKPVPAVVFALRFLY